MPSKLDKPDIMAAVDTVLDICNEAIKHAPLGATSEDIEKLKNYRNEVISGFSNVRLAMR
jgi:hypothetical protein